eukprot:scaffold20388_cov103-Isochrysis_galbana.AAC.1
MARAAAALGPCCMRTSPDALRDGPCATTSRDTAGAGRNAAAGNAMAKRAAISILPPRSPIAAARTTWLPE